MYIISQETAVKKTTDKLKNIEYSQSADLVEELSVAIDDASISILRFLDFVQNVKINCADRQSFTDLDQKQVTLQKEEMVIVSTNKNM